MSALKPQAFSLPYPPSSNRYWRLNRKTGRLYRSPEAVSYIEAVGWELNRQQVGEPISGPVSVSLTFVRPPGRRIDLDNGFKILLDALKGTAYADDVQIVRIDAEIIHIPKGEQPFVVVAVFPTTIKAWRNP